MHSAESSATSSKGSAQVTETTPRVASTAVVFSRISETVERLVQQGASRTQIRVALGTAEEVKIQLNWRGDVLHIKFSSDSDRLLTALRENWDAFTRQIQDRGLRLEPPEFQRNGSDPNDASSGQGSRSGRDNRGHAATTDGDRAELSSDADANSTSASQPEQGSGGKELNVYV